MTEYSKETYPFCPICHVYMNSGEREQGGHDHCITEGRKYRESGEFKRNNPNDEPVGHYTGRCPICGSSDLWVDNTHYGCNNCHAFLG